jgi:hypothetical protein
VSAWGRFCQIINSGWQDDSEDLGNIAEWGPDTVLALDTLNFLGKAALRAVMVQAGLKIDDQPSIQHWGEAIRRIEQRIALLTSPSMKFHLVCNTHIRGVTDDLGRNQHYPAVVGEQLAKDVGAYFNTLVRLDVKPPLGKSGQEKRVIRTVSDHKMNLKSSNPTVLENEEEFDLGKLIRKLYPNT